jgi:hypothetical protein
VVTVSGKQMANTANIDGGRLHLAGSASLASDVAVNNTAAISGEGWVAGNLTMQGGTALVVDGTKPLLVVGSANVAGALLRLGSNFSGSAATPIEILRAAGGIQGSLNTTANQPLGGGLFLQSVTALTNSISIQLAGVAGDYNGNFVVDAADYAVWRNALNQPFNLAIDGNHDGIINTLDYGVWRANFGKTAPVSAAAQASSIAVPEPATLLMLAAGLAFELLGRRRSRARVLV